jgi:hypothetical protein
VNDAYAADYIRRALASETIEAPDSQQANGSGEVLESLYSAHRMGGIAAARTAWETIKRFRPEVESITRKQRKLIPANELKNLSQPEYMIEGYPFYKFAFNVLVGQSGTGKSFVALDFCGRLIKLGLTLVYVAGEGLHGYASRWEVLKQHLGIEDGSTFQFYSEPVQFLDPDARDAFIQELQEHGVKPDFFVIDTLARSAVGIEENSNKEIGAWVAAVDQVCRYYNCGVLVVHHTGKDGKTRGASALIAACDSALMLVKQGSLIKLSNRLDDGGKNKHLAETDPTFVELVPLTVGEFSSAVIRPAKAVIHSPAITGQLNPTQRTILEVMEAYESLKVKDIIKSTELAQSTVYHNLPLLMKSGYIKLDTQTDRYSITEQGKEAFYCG